MAPQGNNTMPQVFTTTLWSALSIEAADSVPTMMWYHEGVGISIPLIPVFFNFTVTCVYRPPAVVRKGTPHSSSVVLF